MSALFLQGNSRDVLKGLPADYFHCAVTSPPYFGLRKYLGGEEIWDGDSGCSHEWGADQPCHHPGQVEQTKWKSAVASGYGQTQSSGNFCQLCGAWKGQLGNEPTPELYLQHLVEICREVRRVLRPDGVFWLNIGDSWATHASGGKGYAHNFHSPEVCIENGIDQPKPTAKSIGIKELDMVLIPEQLALALRADGWYLRSILIWAKGVSLSDEYNGNPMPESVNGWRFEKCRVKIKSAPGNVRGIDMVVPVSGISTDNGHERTEWQDCLGCPKCERNGGYVLRKGSWRPTDSYEYILMLTKTDNYYCDREAVLERGVYPAGESRNGGNGHKSLDAGSRTTEGLHNKDWFGNGGRNLRSVLAVPTRGFSGAHFAVYPPRLIEPLVRAATSEKGCCPKCGSPWARVIDKGFTAHDGETETQYGVGTNANRLALLRQAARERGGEYGGLSYNSKYKEVGVTGLATQGFQRDETIEAEREQSREEAKFLFPDDERKQQDYINHIHDHGGLDKGRTIGWLPTCSCQVQETEPCRVLDPFSGAGTTALIAERLGLDSINIDTSAEYIQLAEARIAEDEQKRIDEQIRQLRKEAGLISKNGS